MPQPPDLLNFLNHLRNLHGLLEHHGNYRGTFEGALMEAQGLALVGSHGRAFNHGASMQQFAGGLNNNLAGLDHILEGFRTRDTSAGSLLTNGVGPFLALCRRRSALAGQTDALIQRIAASPADRARLAGCPARTRERGAGGTVQQWLQAIRARTGWTPQLGDQILSANLMADHAAQAVLAGIEQMPADAAEATAESSASAAASRQLIARYASNYREDSEEFSGYAAALERLWTPHGTLAE
jgi:hypothetical protein